jgi:hypothetical protein
VAFTTAGQVTVPQKVAYLGKKRYIRVYFTVTGSITSTTEVYGMLGAPKRGPIGVTNYDGTAAAAMPAALTAT